MSIWKIGVMVAAGLVGMATSAAGQLSEQEMRTMEAAAEDADNGYAWRAVEAMEELARKYPESFAVAYELGYAQMANMEYAKAAETFRKLEGHKDADDRVWQMEGNALDYMGRRGDASRTYRRGLERHPKSGRLLMEMGNMRMADGDYDGAVGLFERGIEAEPGFASNYYRAAWLLLQSSTPQSGLALGEAFLMMEQTGERAKTMIKMVGDTYIRMSRRGGEMTTARRVAEAKRAMLAMRRGESDNDKAAEIMTAVEEAIERAGHWYAYCAWLTKESDKDGFGAWMTFHEPDMEAFAVWFGGEGERIRREIIGK
ncbi:MAG: tetratricopeptide repeat protein [Bacteroidales bacterium]|nr:tetratricopeptide repeat protein [Bacteroidales bacterium]MDY4174890.1 tetratricopeptide repeat protein [Bacteroidales bacterium]